MNTLWPRISCLYPRSASSCHDTSRLLTRLVQRSLRSYSVSSTAIRQTPIPASNLGLVDRKRHSNIYNILNVSRTYASLRRIITKYGQLPKDYSDAKGLRFASRDLTDDEVTRIFGNGIDAHTANQLLSILHGRRVAGTLPDPETEEHATTQEKKIYATALAWLRERIPVDEDRSAVLRATQELRNIENEIVADSQRIGIWHPNASNNKNIYGDSAFEALRAANKKIAEEKEKKRELSQADEIRQNTGTLQTFDPKSQIELRRPGEHPRLKEYLARAQIEPDFSPETTPFKRLWPSALVTLFVLGLSWTFATFYTPPKTSTRLYPDIPPAAATIFTIMLVNTVVFAAWRVPAAWRMLNIYFMTLPAKPNPLSLLGNTFSHQQYLFGYKVEEIAYEGRDHEDTHASNSKWRHQESASYYRHANAAPRKDGDRHTSSDLADFFNDSRIETPKSSGSGGTKHRFIPLYSQSLDGTTQPGTKNEETITVGHISKENTGTAEVKCGPLLNYRRMENQTWFGSVLIVTQGGGHTGGIAAPVLLLKTIGRRRATNSQQLPNGDGTTTNETYGVVNGVDYTGFGALPSTSDEPTTNEKTNGDFGETGVEATKLYSDSANTFWRFDLQVSMQDTEIQCEYQIPGLKFAEGKKIDKQNFFVPAITESMRIMFHSCNGFSVGTDEKAWSGAALWNDVQRVHQITPFHVMIGGGDQIYNDGIRVEGPLRAWADISNPKRRRDHDFPESLRKACDNYYVNNYIRWYSTEPFAGANGQIAQLNIWDDHDIIDGFGSYVDDFMHCPVFRGIGGVAHKWYLLFQHHLAPPPSTYTTDAPQTMGLDSVGLDERQTKDTFVLKEKTIDPSYIIGPKPGPYVVEHSRSIYTRLGSRIGFFGIDARTERTRKQVNYPETYEIIFSRLRQELGAAASSPTPIRHLIVLLGIPIAYPRLTWLENIFSSPVVGPLKFLNKRFGFGGSLFNKFDGNIDLLDDLDDHYTARAHKKERAYIIHQLQELAGEFSVRISILGGDVHLAAIGRFYSNPILEIPIEADHRYMVNIVSSAIVNKPPPQAVANLLARRNRLHHLDHYTDETLMKLFDKDPGDSNKTASSNRVTMPCRNWAMITENSTMTHALTNSTNGAAINGTAGEPTAEVIPLDTSLPKAKDGHSWLHKGEENAGSKHKAADSEQHGQATDGSLDVCIRVEINQHDEEGKTRAYGMTIPQLVYKAGDEKGMRKRDHLREAAHLHGRD
ncbi:hypothetical protein B7494_g3755 [Chlorociboria aeruginascens]|nr:hypothetical protein B7494_g3755 [Chlorociboria aeruginascens]